MASRRDFIRADLPFGWQVVSWARLFSGPPVGFFAPYCCIGRPSTLTILTAILSRLFFLEQRRPVDPCEFSLRRKSMTDISQLAPRERAERYRELAREARFQIPMSSSEATRVALAQLAANWEELASEIEAGM
jgi:hypothetical protein